MVISQNVRKDYREKHMIVTYNLAVAKLTMHIQEMEIRRFDDLFINLGTFHLEGLYFTALDHIIADSTLPSWQATTTTDAVEYTPSF